MSNQSSATVIDRDLYFEDFAVGQQFITAIRSVDEAEILAFGKRYADQPYHTNPAAAADSIYGGLIAPGYMTAALTFGLFADLGVLRAGGMGSPGVDKLRWHKPVRADDRLHVVAEVADLSPASETGGKDAIRITYKTVNQDGDTVMNLTSLHFIKRRPD
jgi:acyl dehydratase